MTLLDGEWTQAELLALRPPGRLTVSEWAEKFRELDPQAARRGKWSNATLPQLVEPMDAISDPSVEKVVLMMLAQGGKTEIMINGICWAVDQSSDPIMIVQPDKDLAKEFNVDRIQPAFRATRAIARHMTGVKRDWSNHTIRMRTCTIHFASSNSPTDLASKPVRWLFMDEVDKYPRWSGKEASPVKLAEKRTTTYPDAKVVMLCTPTVEDGVINLAYQESDGRKYWVPCPHCDDYQVLVLSRLNSPDGASPKQVRYDRSAWYECQHCKKEIADDTGTLRWMLERGEWRESVLDNDEWVSREDTNSPIRGYHISALYSPFLTWSQLAAEHLETKDEPADYMDFLNSRMAEPWVDSSKGVDDEFLSHRMDDRPSGRVPLRDVVLTMGIDVGGPENGPFKWDWAVRAWGPGMRSWLIEYGTFQSYKFEEFRDEVLYRSWEDGHGNRHYVERALMDDGWNTDKVKDWCRTLDPLLYPCKGFEEAIVPVRSALIDGLEVRYLDVNALKDTMFNLMGRPNDHPGRWSVHTEICKRYRRHMCTEHRVPPAKTPGKRARGRHLVWRVKHGLGSPHYWDAEVYALAAAKDLGLHTAEARPLPEPEHQIRPDETFMNEPESRRRRRGDYHEGDDWFDGAEDFLG